MAPEDKTGAAAEKIVRESSDVRESVRRLVTNTMQERKLDLKDLNAVVRDVIAGAGKAVEESSPSGSEIREVLDGLTDALSVSANATFLALEEAKTRGEQFAKDDLKSAASQLMELERKFLDTLSDTAGKFSSAVGNQITDFVSHARNTGTSIRPSVEKALEAAGREPASIIGDAVSTGAKASVKTAGMLMETVGTFIQTAGEFLTKDRNKSASD